MAGVARVAGSGWEITVGLVNRSRTATGAMLMSIVLVGMIASGAAGAKKAGTGISVPGVNLALVGVKNIAEPSGYGPIRATALAGYKEIYTQDFAGSKLPVEWDSYSGVPGGDSGAMFSGSHVSVGGGVMRIATYQDTNYSGSWVTGGVCLCGKPGQIYGAWFVRSRITGPGDDNVELLWPDTNSWPPEIDFNETGGGTRNTTATIHWGATNHQAQSSLKIDMTKWHTWGVIWTKSAVSYLVDGRVWAKVTTFSEIPSVAMHLGIQSQTFCQAGWACPTSGTTNSEIVDWVSEFSFGAN